MSLVVLRSWTDGQPPKVRAIAPPDSDKDEVVIPDNNGRFVTTEINRKRENGIGSSGDKNQKPPGQPPTAQPRSSLHSFGSLSNRSTTNSSSTPSPEIRTKSGQFLSNSINRNEKAKTLPHDFTKMEPLSLSRESSVNSGMTDSPPSSPVCGSRYKNLGPELAATIPRRQITRETWIKESHSNFKKKEMSKSTPALNNISLEEEDYKEEPIQEYPQLQPPKLHNPIINDRNNSNPFPIPPRPLTSYFDTFYGSDGEPKFGDRPASVVQVFKKDPSSITSQQQLTPTPTQKHLISSIVKTKTNEALNSIDNPQLSPTNNHTSTRVSLQLNLTNSNSPKKFKAIRSYSSEIHRDDTLTNPNVVTELIKDSLPGLPFSINPLPLFQSQVELPLLSSPAPATIDFQVNKVIHSDTPPPPTLIDTVNVEQDTSPLNSSFKISADEKYFFLSNPQNLNSERKGKDENEEIDLELEALRADSSRSTTTTAEITTPFVDSPDNNDLIPGQSDYEMSTTCSSSAASSPQFFFNDPRQRSLADQIMPSNGKQRSTNHGNSRVNPGSAWVQVPVQCINRHVFLPDQQQQPTTNRVKPPEPPRHLNNDHNQNNVYRTNQRRKNFCDDLLNDVILQVPQHVRSRGPPLSSPPLKPQNHDGIIIFDEEEEDELILMDSETESNGGPASEKEKSMEYISVFHNVQVGSINDQSHGAYKSSNPELTRVIGLDLGSLTTRYASLDKITASVELGEVLRTLTTSDGHRQGPEAISHAMASKSKIIYKWKAKQSFPYDPYDDEDCATTLETLLRHYRHLHISSGQTKGERKENGTQWNLSIHSGMDKKLVREAALNSGLMKSNDELRLVNESTAAAAMAFQFLQRQTQSWGKTFLSVNIGATFIHTSGYEIRGSKLHIIESSDSQLYESPESNLSELFSRLFGREFILKYESAFQPSWIKLLSEFDEMKDLFYKCHAECYLFLPISFYIEYTKFTGMQILECLEDNIEEGVRWDKNGAIRFNPDLMKDWLQPTVNFIKTRLKIKTYDSIVLSGGGVNQFIANELSRLLPLVNVFKLPDPETAVAEGLVRIDSGNLTLKSPFSIGVGVMTPFDESIHPKEKCVTRQGKKWCSDVWDTLIRKGQPLTIGQAVLKRSYVGAQPGQNILVLPIFKSDQDEPKLVTSPSVEKCCELRFEINREKAWREVQLVIKCYESELIIMGSGNDGDLNQVVIDF